MRTYQQLTREQRYQIDALLRAGHSRTHIARVLGVHRCTVCRELRRNRAHRGYLPRHAHLLALSRRQSKAKRRLNHQHWTTVRRLMLEDWSPEQISRRLVLEGGFRVSHEWIYQFVLADKRAGGNLYRYLRCQKQHRKRYGKHHRMRGGIVGRVGISQRPGIVKHRRRFGDWEADTLAGRRWSTRILSLVERKSRYTVLGSLANKSASHTAQCLISRLRAQPHPVRTLTVDNGQEFAAHRRIAQRLRTRVYFSDFHAPWQRGTIENTNGLLRQYFPKRHDFNRLRAQDLAFAQARLNNRPRKCLGFRTPYEIFFATTVALTS
jgi:transposase, IS30 family